MRQSLLVLSKAHELDFLVGDLLTDPEEFRKHVGGTRYRVAIRAANKLGAAIQKARGKR